MPSIAANGAPSQPQPVPFIQCLNLEMPPIIISGGSKIDLDLRRKPQAARRGGKITERQ
jgi:hypothetical protein